MQPREQSRSAAVGEAHAEPHARTKSRAPAERKILEHVLTNALSGAGAHAATDKVFSGLDWKRAGVRPLNAPHSAFEILNHLLYWQDWVLEWLDGAEPPAARHAADGWPGNTVPRNTKEWAGAVSRFRVGLKTLARQARRADLTSSARGKTPAEMLQAIASHNSYHAAQVVVLRQQLGAWPPRSGGLTW